MSAGKTCKNIFTVPAGIPFGTALAAHLWAQHKNAPEDLSAIRILLPTRRACRALREAFLQQSGGKPLLLPYMHPVGDIDEDELSLGLFGAEIADLPPAMPALRRQTLLAEMILKLPAYADAPARAMKLAETLGRLMDQITIEGLDPARLADLVPADFAAHWQITLEFLKIVTHQWPEILKEQGLIDAAARRDALIRALTRQWKEAPLQGRIIAAGSTGSIPATAELLQVISTLPNGQVVLPGLDRDMDIESWDALTPDHPQHGLKRLLEKLGCAREEVSLWPAPDTPANAARRFLATELMRPAATAARWQELTTSRDARASIQKACENLRRFECENEREEAQVISLLLREALETPGRTAALVTPDRRLAKRVAQDCARWGVRLDDSAGTELGATRVGTLLRLVHEAARSNCAPAPLLALLKHDLCALEQLNAPLRKTLSDIEIHALRGPRPRNGLKGILQRLERLEDQNAYGLIAKLTVLMEPFLKLAAHPAPQSFETLLAAHICLAEKLARREALWSGEDGEAAGTFLADLMAQARHMPPASFAEYGLMVEELMRGVTVRPSYSAHPRVMALGQLEARMLQADLVILGGLNEGTWPADPGHDPWMSRPMRERFGLPALERATGLSAHDFQQGFCAPQVVLTRSRRAQGAPATPSRWLQRLDTVLAASGAELQQTPHLQWARALDKPDSVVPAARPAPRPPASARPREISVTRVETWLKDPYSIYARDILKLRKLEDLDRAPDAAARGELLHKILERFVQQFPREIPPDAETKMYEIALEELDKSHDDPAVWRFWRPRLARIADWLAAHERQWRQTALPLKLEASGRMEIPLAEGSFALKGKADRIDQTHDGKAVLIDYKSGGSYTQKDMESGRLPQLPLEAAMAEAGAFEGLPPLEPAALSYWKLTGGREPGEEVAYAGDVAALAQKARDSLQRLAEIFAREDTPYLSLPRPEDLPRFNDYERLARVKEWADVEGGEEAA